MCGVTLRLMPSVCQVTVVSTFPLTSAREPEAKGHWNTSWKLAFWLSLARM